jgi:lipopolysaccharide/colanic/teichoic acid biosynthesis glycosyltransferase
MYDCNPSYGFLCRLKRIGKEGKIINVYKLRTMHPYAEYLQEYVCNNNHISKDGKFTNDYRVTNWGKILRKLWIDEFPMFINIMKGELKLFGVRPLSQHYYNLYRDSLKQKRKKYKPGLVPPYYVDMPKSLDEIMDSEEKYLDEYEKNPLMTDVKYFSKAVSNILFKGARSS